MQQLIKEFMEKNKLPIAKFPRNPEDNIRYRLIAELQENLRKLTAAINKQDVLIVAQLAGDLTYKLYGLANLYGISMDAIIKEIHESKMNKKEIDINEVLFGHRHDNE